MNEWLWLALAFFSGSVPYSLLLGKLLLKRDIRRFGDGNPGATNLIRAGGGWWGGLAILLDGLKAAIPVGWVYWFDRPVLPWMAAIALAPVLGHAYSPFLAGKGGKAIASMFGVWTGLTLFEAPLILGAAMGLFYLIFENSGWVVLFSEGVLGVFLWLYHPDPLLGAVWILLFLLSAWKHRADLARPQLVRASVHKILSRLR
ncbi:MAG: glycerol-3-phosphate acyltransferase [Chloroflexota bacterium]|nr:MAG: glycerol-3-phosphate acyltransferase 1 [Bellilinea sp.]